MDPSLKTVLVGFIMEMLLIQKSSSKWNFYDGNGHRVRHNRYWRMSDYPSVTCSKLNDIPNGRVRLMSPNHPGGTAIYTCNDNYVLKGNKKRVCLANGRWSGPNPSCVSQKYCGPPPVIIKTIHDADPDRFRFPADTTIRYRCQEGFYYDHVYSQAICKGGNIWKGPDITCRPKSCGHPGVLENGRRINDEFYYKQKVVFLCNSGYKLICKESKNKNKTSSANSSRSKSDDSNCQVRRCQSNGEWSGGEPSCVPITCPRLRNPAHGIVQVVLHTVNSIATYICDPGYYSSGSRTRLCLKDGTWDGGNVTCKVWDCGMPPFSPHAQINYTNTTYGSKAIYRCAQNSSFTGESEILECGSFGMWTPKEPQCLSHCPMLKVINGTISVNSGFTEKFRKAKSVHLIPHAITVNVNCSSGYRLRKRISPRCENGSWSVVPECEPAPCLLRPPIGLKAQARFYSQNHGAEAYYSCFLGYNKTGGQNILKCEFGKWVGTPPTCEVVHCPKPMTPENGLVYLVGIGGRWAYQVHSMLPEHNQLIEYQCKPGYRIKGHDKAVCMNGEWRPAEIPKCEIILHKRLPLEWVFYKPRAYYSIDRRA